MPSKLPEISIKIDTREQKPWVFEAEEKKAGDVRIIGSEVGTIDAADYAIVGAEDLVRIERKMGLRELFGNYSPVDNKERFEREMEKLRDIPHKYLLIEGVFSLDAFALSVPQYKGCGPPGGRIIDWLIKLNLEYGINIIPVNDCGNKVAKMIFRNIARKYL